MKYFLLYILVFVSFKSVSQPADSLSIFDCFQLARENSPYVKMFDLNQSIKELKVEAHSTQNLPSISAYGKAWYQSDAVAVPAQLPGIEGFELDRFQYNFGAEVQQKIYDGGTASRQIAIDYSELSVKNAQSEVSVYQVYDQVNQYYFSILTLQETKNLLQLKENTLTEKIKEVESGVRNGVILKSNLEKLKVEKIALSQELIGVEYSIESLKGSLSKLIGAEKSGPLKRSVEVNPEDFNEHQRPEHQLLRQKEEQLSSLQEISKTQLMPKLYGYGQLGYSYPGLNFFENQSDPYYIVGLKVGWQIYDWNKTKKEREVLEVRKKELEVQKRDLDRNISIAEDSKLNEIEKVEELIQKDREIISMRKSITESSSSALENGTITSAEYLEDLNAELAAKLSLKKNIILLAKHKTELLIIRGLNIDTK